MKTLGTITLLLCSVFLSAQSLPFTFESAPVTEDFVDFDGGVATVIANPQMDDDNPSATVAQIVRNGGEIWAGSKVILDENLDFSQDWELSMKVFCNSPVGTVVKFKLEGDGQTEVDQVTTVTGAWETLTWNFFGTPTNYNEVVFMFDFGVLGDGSAGSTFLFDDVKQNQGAPPLDLPVTFEDPNLDYTLTDFGGTQHSIITDPEDASNTVAEVVKGITSATWAGTTIGSNAGFATYIPLSMTESKMYARVWSPDAGIPVRLKVEDALDATHTCETETLTTTSEEWELMEFDFANEAPGTAALQFGLDNGWAYNMASIFFNFDTDGATAGEKTYYFDDVSLDGVIDETPLLDLPVNFDEVDVNYTMTDFGGNMHSLTTDPLDVLNTVCEVVKPESAESWSGTSIGTAAGFASDIPFTMTETTMYARVWSPDAGIPVRLKVEDADDDTHTCETETLTTLSGEWEVIVWDFATEVDGTPTLASGLDDGWVYNLASIFFNFGTDGATAGEKTYLFDDVTFGAWNPINIDEIESHFTVYPNPAVDVINVVGTQPGSTYQIYDVQGRVVDAGSLQTNNTITVSNLMSGSYILLVLGEDSTEVRRFVRR